MRTALIIAIGMVIVASVPARTQDDDIQITLRHTCIEDTEFLRVSLSTPERDDFPPVQLTLTDPRGRGSGLDTSKRQIIPHSRYARVVELPPSPDRSRAIAAEICRPSHGQYRLTVEEQEAARYRLTISGDGKNQSSSEWLHLVAHKGRKRYYEFNYLVNDDKAVIEILSQTGKPLTPLELFLYLPNEW